MTHPEGAQLFGATAKNVALYRAIEIAKVGRKS
ncbi:MAG: hypothetical protein RLZZ224_1384, partial [Verrucomicrobiota bacterium]